MNFEDINIYAVDTDGNKEILAKKVAIANTFLLRLKGLLFEKTLEKEHALIIYPCSSIHMMFMSFSIDVAYADSDLRVLKLVKGIKPWQVDKGIRGAKYVLELPAGTITKDIKKIEISKELP